MGSSGGPHGQVVGLFKCVSKSLNVTEDDTLIVTFGAKGCTMSLTLSKEVADEYVVGNSYEFRTFQP